MPKKKNTKNNRKKSKTRKRKGGRLPTDDDIPPGSEISGLYKGAIHKQAERQGWRKKAETNFNYGPNDIPINPHISYHLGKKIGDDQWQGDGYYEYTGQDDGYCFKSDGEVDESEKENKKKFTDFANEKKCCGMGEIKAYDKNGDIIKYDDGTIASIYAPKIPNIRTGTCDPPINFTNTLCSGGEIYLKEHDRSLCCPLGQTPDVITGECREDLTNKHPEVILKRSKRIADKTGVSKVVKTAVKGATIVAAGGVGACFVFPPCAIVLAIAICIGLGMSALKIKNAVKDERKLKEIVDNGHELLAKLSEIESGVSADGKKYKKEDSVKAATLLARIRDCSRKIVKQPSDIGDEFMSQLVGKVPNIKFDKNEKKWYVDKSTALITKKGLVVGKIKACCDEKGNNANCGNNTHVKTTYVPRPDNLSQTLLLKTGKNADNVRLINAYDDAIHHKKELTELKTKLEKSGLSDKEYKSFKKLSPSQGDDKILDKNALSSRGGTGFVKLIKKLFAGRDAVRKYNNVMNEIQALIEEIDNAEKAGLDEITKTKEKVNALFKRAVNKITALRKFGALGNLGKKEQIYPITFNQASDFDVACSKFAKPIDNDVVNNIEKAYEKDKLRTDADNTEKQKHAHTALTKRIQGRKGNKITSGGKGLKSRKKRFKKSRKKRRKSKKRKSRRKRRKNRRKTRR